MLRIVEDACRFTANSSQGTVVVESDITGPNFGSAWFELESPECVTLAQQHAVSRGCAPAFLNNTRTSPYPVNSEGTPLDLVRDEKGEELPPTHAKRQPFRYRVEIQVARPVR
jgi:hypothetical protein